MRNVWIITKRELAAYFGTGLAYVFAVIFVALSGAFAFFVGNFFERGQADLVSFFQYHPWLYLLLVPAVAMRLWAEERKTGTIELLMTLPVTTGEAIVGKFLAAWAFIGFALLLTVPMWITVNYLGKPDNGVILTSYIGSFLMAGAFLAIGSCISALTKNQVIAFIVAATICFLLVMRRQRSGAELFPRMGATYSGRGDLELELPHQFRPDHPRRDLAFGALLLPLHHCLLLFANAIIVEQRKAA